MSEAPCLGGGPTGGHARWLKTADGLRLRGVFWPQTGARGTVVILPGRTEHAEKYGPLAELIAQQGYAVAAIDWRGQGLSDRLLRDPRKGHVGNFADYQTDLEAYRQALQDLELPQPWFMLAHSMGGCIGLRALTRGFPVAAAAFSAPMWGIHMPGRHPVGMTVVLAGLTHARLGQRYAPPPGSGPVCYLETAGFDGNCLTSDRATWDWLQHQVRANPAIALAGPTIGWVAAALAECRALGRLALPALPCLVTLGSDESLVDSDAILTRIDAWPSASLLRLQGARHEIPMERPELRDQFLSRMFSLFAEQSG